VPGEAAIGMQPDGGEPEFGAPTATSDVHVNQLRPITRGQEPVRSYAQDSRLRVSSSHLNSRMRAGGVPLGVEKKMAYSSGGLTGPGQRPGSGGIRHREA
jgi:hypothetical protein